MATSRRGRRGQLDKCSGLPADASSFVSRVPLDLARGQEGVSVCVTAPLPLRRPLLSIRN